MSNLQSVICRQNGDGYTKYAGSGAQFISDKLSATKIERFLKMLPQKFKVPSVLYLVIRYRIPIKAVTQ